MDARGKAEVMRMDAGHGAPGAGHARTALKAPVSTTDPADVEPRREEVLSVLEPDQLFAAKQHARLGPARLSRGTRVLMWGLRVYVIAMLVIVVVAVMQTLHGGH
ncbi:MAG TPA: hypothetical protein VGZ23_08630 [bacterium]|nr:hypothetical protein [bacterium]